MIQISPPLMVTADGLVGSLIAIDSKKARINWQGATKPQAINQVMVNYGGDKHLSLGVKFCSENLYEFSTDNHSAVQDLLHILRKGQHIDLCVNQDVEHSGKRHGFDELPLPVVALPEVAWDDVSARTTFLGKTFNAPILITGMTGGIAQGSLINERLAHCADTFNIPMGVGSQRIALENPAHANIFRLKDKFPKLFLIGNLGIGQLQQKDFVFLCQRAVDMIEADALAIHVNVLQELIQVEGDRNFRGLLDKIGIVQQNLSVPVIVKEVGAGLDTKTAQKLWDRGIRCFDIGGAGGTSWAHIEGLRASNDLIRRRGEVFRNWGIPTAKALVDLRAALPKAEIIATGGIRTGLTVLKAIYHGANMAGVGLPLLRAAISHEDAPLELMGAIIDEYKIAKICSGLV